MSQLTGASGSAPSSVNLTTQGSTDWNYPNSGGTSEKKNVTSKITFASANPAPDGDAGGGVLSGSSSPASCTWTGRLSRYFPHVVLDYLLIHGAGNYFTVTAPASTTAQTLYVYCGSYGMDCSFVAHLSDSSSSDYSVTLSNSSLTTVMNVYTLTYAAASSGQTLTVTFTSSTGHGYGASVLFQAATLGAAAGNNYTKSLTESVTLSSTLARSTLPGAKLETFSLTDSRNLLVSRALSESLPISEAAATKLVGRIVADALTPADSTTRSTSRGLTDAAVLNDSRTQTLSRSLLEAFTLADVIALARTKALALLDVVGFSDAIARAMNRSLSDALLLSDTRANSKSTALLDSVSPADSATRAVARGLAEVMLISDARSLALSRIVLDSLTLADVFSIIKTKVLALLDALLFSDSTTRSVSRGLADVQPFSESRTNSLNRSPVFDSLTVTDAFSLLRTKLLALLDALLFSDSINRSTSRSLTDSQTLSDVRNQALSRAALSDTIPASDLLSRQSQRTLADVLSWRESLSRLVAKVWSDAAGLTDAIANLYSRASSTLGTVHKFVLKAATRLWPVKTSVRKWILTGDVVITTSKDPGAIEDFQFDWTAELGPTDTIATSIWTVPAGLSSVTASFTTKTTQVRLSGGVVGRTYVVPNQVTLLSGQTKVRALHITVDLL